jgi:hypothetical protein
MSNYFIFNYSILYVDDKNQVYQPTRLVGKWHPLSLAAAQTSGTDLNHDS